MANQSEVVDLAVSHFAKHGLVNYSFGFDRAVRRAGQCDFRARRITLSKHLVATASLEDVEQVLLHEIAHALVGKDAGHSKVWRERARAIGYRFERVDWEQLASGAKHYLGSCPNGHNHLRVRKPKGARSCRKCADRFDDRYLIRWELAGPDQ